MFMELRSVLIWLLAAGGVLVFGAYIVAVGTASQGNPPAPPEIRPAALVDFGVAAGTLLATNLGAVLGIAVTPGTRGSFARLRDAQQEPWAQLGGAVIYIALLGLALYFYWQSDWSDNAAEVLKTSLATLIPACCLER